MWSAPRLATRIRSICGLVGGAWSGHAVALDRSLSGEVRRLLARSSGAPGRNSRPLSLKNRLDVMLGTVCDDDELGLPVVIQALTGRGSSAPSRRRSRECRRCGEPLRGNRHASWSLDPTRGPHAAERAAALSGLLYSIYRPTMWNLGTRT